MKMLASKYLCTLSMTKILVAAAKNKGLLISKETRRALAFGLRTWYWEF
jgi:hypothetical protein